MFLSYHVPTRDSGSQRRAFIGGANSTRAMATRWMRVRREWRRCAPATTRWGMSGAWIHTTCFHAPLIAPAWTIARGDRAGKRREAVGDGYAAATAEGRLELARVEETEKWTCYYIGAIGAVCATPGIALRVTTYRRPVCPASAPRAYVSPAVAAASPAPPSLTTEKVGAAKRYWKSKGPM